MKNDAFLLKTLLALLLLANSFFLSLQEAVADRERPATFGSIELEQKKVRVNPKERAEQESILLLNSITELVKTNKADNSTLPNLSDNGFLYFNALFFYCVLKGGNCEFVISPLMIADYLNKSYKLNLPQCYYSLNFWKSWIDNSMERKLGFKLSVGHLKKWEKFKREIRPNYLKCKEYLLDPVNKKILNQKLEDIDKTIKKLRTFQKLLKNKGVDVFYIADIILQ